MSEADASQQVFREAVLWIARVAGHQGMCVIRVEMSHEAVPVACAFGTLGAPLGCSMCRGMRGFSVEMSLMYATCQP